MITAHTDVVGSLLRPGALRKARDEWKTGRLSHAQFKSIEDGAVDEAVSLQEAAGLDIVTDGEMRRLSFQSQMIEAVDGFGAWDIGTATGPWGSDAATGRSISAWSAGSCENGILSPRSSSICAAAQAASQR